VAKVFSIEFSGVERIVALLKKTVNWGATDSLQPLTDSLEPEKMLHQALSFQKCP
jgi:hypothetical protein